MGYARFRWLPTLQANIIAFSSNIMFVCANDGQGETPEGRQHDLNTLSVGHDGMVVKWGGSRFTLSTALERVSRVSVVSLPPAGSSSDVTHCQSFVESSVTVCAKGWPSED